MKVERVRNTVTQMPDREVKPGELIENVQICPVGDYPNGGKNQHCTLESLQNVAEDWSRNGKKEILVDFEHNSESTDPNNDTSAAAWVSNIRVDPSRGLVGDFKMTDVGAEAVSNRRLRFLSVSWFVNKDTREPIRITSIALTNKPNIPVEPILNKEGKIEEIENVTDANGLSHGADGRFDGGNGSASGNGGKTRPHRDSYDSMSEGEREEFREAYRQLRDHLGGKKNISGHDQLALQRKFNLGSAAAQDLRFEVDEDIKGHGRPAKKKGNPLTDDDYKKYGLRSGILAKRQNKQERNNMDKIKEALGLAPEATEEQVLEAITAMVKANKDAEQAALEKEAEDFAEKNKAKLDPVVIKAQYVANKAACMAIVDAIPEKKPEAQQMLNKAKEPGKAADLVNELNKCKTPQERIEFAQQHASEFAE